MVQSKFFNMGQILITRGISETVGESERFAAEVLSNSDDLYLLAAYKTSKGRIWIITNRISEKAGDNATTVLFPYER